MAEPTNEQLAEAARLGVEVDGRWSAETLGREIANARRFAELQDAAVEEMIASQTDEEIDALEAQMTAEAKSDKSPGTELMVYLDYDTWVPDDSQPDGYRRIVADPVNPQSLPRVRAKELLLAGKARRADPLPGE